MIRTKRGQTPQERPLGDQQDRQKAPRRMRLTPRAPALILAAILVLAGGARLYGLGAKSYWLDEATSVWLANLGFMPEPQRAALGLGGRIAAMVRNVVAHDAHPPAHQILLLLSLEAFGDSEFAARLPSALAGLLTVGLLFRLGRILYGRRAGLAAALLGAVSAHLVYFSQEARLYSLLALISTAHACLLLDCLRLRRRAGLLRWGAYVAAGAAGMWTHGLYGLVLAGHWLFWGLYAPRKRRSLIVFGVAQAVMIACFLPWVPHMRDKAAQVRESLAERPGHARPLEAEHVAPALLDSVAGLHLALADTSPALAATAASRSLVFTQIRRSEAFRTLSVPVWTFALAAMLAGAFRRGRRKARLYPLALVPIAAALALPAPRVHVFETKHVFFAVPFLILAVASNVGGRQRAFRLGAAAFAILVAVNAWGAVAYLRPSFEKEPWRQALAELEAQATEDARVVFAPDYAVAPYFAYETKSLPFTTSGPLIAAIQRGDAPDIQRLWLVELENPVSRPTVEMGLPDGEGFVDVPVRTAVDIVGPWDIAAPSRVHRGYLGGIRVTEFAAPEGAQARGGGGSPGE